MLLSELFAEANRRDTALGWELRPGPEEPEVTGVRFDSRRVGPGDLFCCIPGEQTDGHLFGADAVAAGASALLVEEWLELDIPQVRVNSARAAMAWLAAIVHGDPASQLHVVGVTGTNGKTTTVHLIQAILSHNGVMTEVVGTLSGTRTTPEAPELQEKLRGFVDAGVEAVAMEVSSHALVQNRVTGIRFAVGIFTNLSPEHLDYHGSLDHYFEAKAMLFAPGVVSAAAVNVDDPRGAELLSRLDVPATGFSRGLLKDVSLSLDGSTFSWRGHQVDLSLPGLFNLDNAVAAAEAVRFLGLGDAQIASGLSAAPQVPGRFEVIAAHGEPSPVVIVDYSHTPAGIEQVLRSVREIAPDASVCIVFGAGGDRDREKRPLMGAAAAANADHVIVTSDNPRSEDPAVIIAEIMAGIEDRSGVETEADRRVAIGRAVAIHTPSDVVVVAGKGHETTQTIGDQVLVFDDRQVVRELVGEGAA